MLGQVLEQLDAEHRIFKIVKVDIDENPELTRQWKVSQQYRLFFYQRRTGKRLCYLPKPVSEQKMKAL